MKQSLTDIFVSDVENLILNGVWKKGEKIPPLRALAESFGVSRSVVNAAVAELEEKGFLCCFPRRGISVADWEREGTLSVLTAIVKHDIDNRRAIGSIFDSRLLIETEAASAAAAERTEQDLSALLAVVESEENASPARMVSADMDFHRALVAAGHNMVYTAVLNAFREASEKLIKRFYLDNEEVLHFVRSKHRAIYDAIERRDGKTARRLTAELLEHGRKIIENA